MKGGLLSESHGWYSTDRSKGALEVNVSPLASEASARGHTIESTAERMVWHIAVTEKQGVAKDKRADKITDFNRTIESDKLIAQRDAFYFLLLGCGGCCWRCCGGGVF
jgi:hypothetical protein